MEQNKSAGLSAYLKIARFDHWIKQLFIIPGVVFALFLLRDTQHFEFGPMSLRFALGFISTCFIASANYVINEWLDAEFDQFHPTKKHRPVVAKNMKGGLVAAEYLLFAVLGLGVALLVSLPVFFMELWLLVMGLVYNVKPIRSKDIPYVDVLSESVNNAIRLLIGWFVVTSEFLPPITIVLGYWLGGAFLMATKRFAEYRMIGDAVTAGLYRKSFQRYTESKLLISAFFYALLSVFFTGIFMMKYKIELLLAVPFLCGLFCLYFSLSFKYDSSVQKPEKLFREKFLMLYLGLFLVLICVLLFVELPFMHVFLDPTILGVG